MTNGHAPVLTEQRPCVCGCSQVTIIGRVVDQNRKVAFEFLSFWHISLNLPVLWEVNSSSVHTVTFLCRGQTGAKIFNAWESIKAEEETKSTKRFCFSLNCERYWAFLCLFRSTLWGTKNNPSSLAPCMGRGSSVAPFAPQHILLSQYRAQTTVALCPPQLNWKIFQPCLWHFLNVYYLYREFSGAFVPQLETSNST